MPSAIQDPMPDDAEIKLPIRDPMPNDTEIKCNHPSSPTKDAVTQTCITIEHLSYSNEFTKDEKIFVSVKSAQE